MTTKTAKLSVSSNALGQTQHCAIKIDIEQQIFFVTGPFSPVFWQGGTESLCTSQASSVAAALLQLSCGVNRAPRPRRDEGSIVLCAQHKKQTVRSR